MRRRDGFSLIELLVVIAIIAILAAIIFPVYAQAKKGAYKSSDLSNMNSLRTALQLYKADNGSYPPALLGYVGGYSSDGAIANAIPPSQVRDALYPKRVESLSVFRPALNRVAESDRSAITRAYWPEATDVAKGAKAMQRFTGNDLVRRASYESGGCKSEAAYYYRISGYDVSQRSNASSAPYETRYQRFWSGYTVPNDPCSPADATGNASDTPRQLGYSEPPENTVVTWNTFFRDYTPSGQAQHIKQDLVLFLGGNARPMDSAAVAAQAWTIAP